MLVAAPTCQFDVHVGVQQEVLSLQVPMDNVMAVTVIHGRQDLPELLPRLDFTHPAVRSQIICRRKQNTIKQHNRSQAPLSFSPSPAAKPARHGDSPNISPLLAYSVTMYSMSLVSMTCRDRQVEIRQQTRAGNLLLPLG